MLGEVKRRGVCPSDIINSTHNYLNSYLVFPGGDFTLSTDWPSYDLSEIAKQLEILGSIESGSESIIDKLTLALLAHGAQRLPSEFEWDVLADRLALLYIKGFRNLDRCHLRTKAQRANYYIRSMIDDGAEPDCEIIEERRIAVSHPWDFQYIDGGEIYVGSGDGANIYLHAGCFGQTSFRLGMPTQIAKLSEERIAFCSCYRDGWYELDQGQSPIYYPHDRPVVLVFSKNNEEYFLDVDGGIFSKISRQMVLRLPVHIAWRARCIGGFVFVSDCSVARSLVVLELEGWEVSLVNTGPVLLTNDLCAAPQGGYYLIDKMQGRIYLFDDEFRFMRARLAFGLGYGFLSDPIAICMNRDNIHVLSWLGDRVTVVRQF